MLVALVALCHSFENKETHELPLKLVVNMLLVMAQFL